MVPADVRMNVTPEGEESTKSSMIVYKHVQSHVFVAVLHIRKPYTSQAGQGSLKRFLFLFTSVELLNELETMNWRK